MNALIQCKTAILPFLIASVLAGFGFLPKGEAVVPPPDGGYPGRNTAAGQNALFSLTSGTDNTAVGWFSLRSVTTGQFNTAIGVGALSANTTDLNTATGAAALFMNTSGFGNTANGALSLFNNTTGGGNTANGSYALFSNSTGQNNTAMGWNALVANTTGDDNTALGYRALVNNTTGFSNTALGIVALERNTTGSNNTAVGRFSLNNITGDDNTAVGVRALGFNSDGNGNTAIGHEALFHNDHGSGQTAVGYRALQNSTASGQFCFANTAVGSLALDETTTGCSNTAIGSAALGSNTSGDFNVAVGLLAGSNVTTADNVICIGTDVQGANVSNGCYIGNIWNQQSFTGQTVFVNSDGKLGNSTSSRRFKDEIKAMDKASEAVLALQPVTFRYKKEFDPSGAIQFGLVAEDVERVNPDLVVRDEEGKPNSVRYDQVNAMLLNEFLKEHRNNQEQGATIAEQQKEITALKAELKAQASQIQKVSAELESTKRPQQVALNNR